MHVVVTQLFHMRNIYYFHCEISFSRVIYNLILKRQRELDFQEKSQRKQNKHIKQNLSRKTSHHLVISVRKYQPEDFQKIVEYLHCGSVDISTTNVAGKTINQVPKKNDKNEHYQVAAKL